MEFGVLGTLEVLAGSRVLPLASARQRALLAALLVAPGEVVSTDRLVEALWPGELPPRPQATLQVHVSNVRAALAAIDPEHGRDVIVTRTPGYLIRTEPDAVDAVRFERLAEEGRRALLRQQYEDAARALRDALNLWRGPAYADLPDLDAARARAAHLEDRRVSVLEDRIDADLGLGQHGAVAAELTRMVSDHPHRERMHAQLMLALYRSGRQADALAAYQHLRNTLVDELGIDPRAEVQALEQAILLQKPELDWHPVTEPGSPRHLRRPSRSTTGTFRPPETSFVGRDLDLQTVVDALADPGLVTIVGPGGAGKTRLALEAAATDPRSRSPRSSWRVALDAVSAGRVWEALAAGTGAAQAPGVAPDAAVFRAVAAGGLLVVDNCEHVLTEAAEAIAAVVVAAPNVTVLATSRTPLGVDGERVHPLPSLGTDAAASLFLDRVSAARPDIDTDAIPPDVVERICAAVDHLPLGVELAAARVTTLDPIHLADHLTKTLSPLESHGQTTPRHRTLRAAVQWSYDLLAEEDRRVLRALSVFPGPFTLPDAASITEAETSDSAELAAALDRLVRASLLVVEGGSPLRYRLLATVRQFAEEELAESAEEPEVRRRQVERAVEVSKSLATTGKTDVARMQAVELNLVAAAEWALAPNRAPSDGVRIITTLFGLWHVRGSYTQAERWRERLVRVLDESAIDEGQAARAHLALGDVAFEGGRWPDAVADWQVAIDLGEKTGKPEIVRRARYNLAHHRMTVGEAGVAEELSALAAESRSAGDDDLLVKVLHTLTLVVRRQGDFSSAMKIGDEALRVARRLDDQVATAAILIALGNAHQARKQFPEARARLTEAMTVARRTNYARALVAALGSLGTITDDPIEGEVYLEESLALCRQLGDASMECVTLGNLAGLIENSGDLGRARQLWEEARAIGERVGDPRVTAHACAGLARVGRQTAAPVALTASLIRESLERRHTFGDRDRVTESLEVSAGVLLDAGDASGAARLLAAADVSRQELNLPRDQMEERVHAADTAAVRASLGETGWASIVADAQSLDLDLTVKEALEALSNLE